MLSVMVLYKAVHNTHGFIQYIHMYFDNQCCRSKPVLICMEFYSIRKLNKNCIVIFTNCKNKTKQYSLHNFTELVIISTIINKNTHNSLWKKAQCRNPKNVSKKVATLEKTTVLYQSNSLINLCVSLMTKR